MREIHIRLIKQAGPKEIDRPKDIYTVSVGDTQAIVVTRDELATLADQISLAGLADDENAEYGQDEHGNDMVPLEIDKDAFAEGLSCYLDDDDYLTAERT